MEGRLIAFVIWVIIGVLFIVMGIYDFNSKKAKPFGFWANAEVAPIEDVKGYNRALGILWCVYGILFTLIGFPLLDGLNSGLIIIPILGAMLISIAKECYAPDIKSMTETLNDMMKESQDIVEDIPETLFILSNETRQFGAICMLYPEVLKKFCVEKMIDGVFVIPSSIHEVLLMIADKNKVDVGYIRQMIKEVNYENVSEVERLSDSPYYYDVATDTLRIAE